MGKPPCFYVPNLEEVEGTYCFWVVHLSILPSIGHACGILKNMHDRVLKFHIWIHRQKVADQSFFFCFFFLCELSPILELFRLEKIIMKACQQDTSKSIWAMDLKLSQLISNDE